MSSEISTYLTGRYVAFQIYPLRFSEYLLFRKIYTEMADVKTENEIRRVDQLERIVKYTFDNVGQTFSANTLSKYIKSQGRKMDIETVYSYLEKLEKAYILHRCSRYDIKGKEYLKTQEKLYLADPR